MKKILFLLASLFAVFVFDVVAENDRIINKNRLPAQAQQFINTYFKGVELNYAKVEKEGRRESYEVRLANGSKLEFTDKGTWEEVDCSFGEVPAGIVPESIMKFVETNYPGEKVLKIERDRNDYEVKLSNRLELKFNNDFQIIDIDD